ncbi:chaplin [Kitasatospora sp. NPDC036755]|uniref:chaplin n=1 Tax=Kitasatospora sp. NPDC036755 TaxID=3154600 RepID=UPI0033E74027
MATGSVLASTAGYAYAGGAGAQGDAVGSPGVASGNSVQVPIEVPINACGNTLDVVGLLNPSFGNHCANVNGGGGNPTPKPAQVGQPGGGSGATGGGGSAGAGGVDSSGTGGGLGSTLPGAASLPGAGTPGTASLPGATSVPDAATVPGASAAGTTANSAGVISGNSVQAPVDVPVNACGNSVNVAGVGNPAFGNQCANVETAAPVTPTPPVEGCVEACPTPPQVSAEEVVNVARNGAPAIAAEAVVAPAAAQAAQAAPAPTAQLASTGAGGVELLGAAGLALMLGGGVLYRRARAGAR